MKRIQPQTTPAADDPGYPTLEEARTGRRGFLQQALGWAAGAGTVWLLDRVVTDPTAEAGTARLKSRKGWYQVTVSMPPYPRVFGAGYAVCRIVVQTRSRKFARFLLQKSEATGIRKAALPGLKGLTARDVTERKRLTRLRKQLSAALVKHYKKRTKGRVAPPVVTLGLGSRYSCSPRNRKPRPPGGV